MPEVPSSEQPEDGYLLFEDMRRMYHEYRSYRPVGQALSALAIAGSLGCLISAAGAFGTNGDRAPYPPISQTGHLPDNTASSSPETEPSSTANYGHSNYFVSGIWLGGAVLSGASGTSIILWERKKLGKHKK
jgi:hypothetical protein